MPFPRLTNIIIESIGDIAVNFFIPIDPTVSDTGEIMAQVINSDGTVAEESNNLLERLAEDDEGRIHLQNLISLKTYLIRISNEEILPIQGE